MDLAIASTVRVTMKDGSTFEGEVFLHEPETSLLVLEVPHPQSTIKKDVRMLNLGSVEKTEVLVPADASAPVPELPAQPLDVVEARESESLEAAKLANQRIGDGVSPEAQQLFNTLCKTLECRWEGQSIVELKLNVRINPPYTPENIVGEDATALARMRKIVARIQANESE